MNPVRTEHCPGRSFEKASRGDSTSGKRVAVGSGLRTVGSSRSDLEEVHGGVGPRPLRDVFRLEVARFSAPDARRGGHPWNRDVQHHVARPPLERREPRPFRSLRTLRRRLRERDASSRSSWWRRRRRQGQQRRRRRCGQGDGGRFLAVQAVTQVAYTWVCVLLCTWSPSVLPIAFAGA